MPNPDKVPSLFTPPPEDTSISFLRELFGPAMDHILQISGNGTAANALLELLGVINSGVLFFGAMFLSYVTVFGIANTANDGEALGRKWNTFYTPLRTLFSASVLVPSSIGINGIQILVLVVVSWSIGLADNGWKRVVTAYTAGSIEDEAISSVVNDQSFETLAVGAIKMQVCAAAANSAMEKLGFNERLILAQEKENIIKGGRTVIQTKIFYQNSNWSSARDICGTITYDSSIQPKTEKSNSIDNGVDSLQGAIESVRSNYTFALFNGDIQEIANEISKVAEQENGTIDPKTIGKKIEQAREQMTEAMRKTIRQQIVNNNAPYITQMTKNGWVWAGALQLELTRFKGAVSNSTKSSGTYTPGNFNMNNVFGQGTDIGIAIQQTMTRYEALMSIVAFRVAEYRSKQNQKGPVVPSFDPAFSAQDFADGGTGGWAWVKAFPRMLSDSLFSAMVHYLDASDATNAIWRVKDLGDYVVSTAEVIGVVKPAAVGAMTGIAEAAKAGSNQPVVGVAAAALVGAVEGTKAFFLQTMDQFSGAIVMLAYAGYYMSIWFPMIPTVIFTIGVIGWAVAVVETVIAVPLWAVMWMTPEDSFIGSQKQGLLLLLNIFMRPILMLAGLVAGFALINPAVAFINEIVLLSFRIINADSVIGVVAITGSIIVYCFIITSVSVLLFGLSQSAPDRILRFINAGIGSLGEEQTISRVEGGASGQAKTALLAAAGTSGTNRPELQSNVRRAMGKKPADSADQHSGEYKAQPEGHGGQSTVGFSAGE